MTAPEYDAIDAALRAEAQTWFRPAALTPIDADETPDEHDEDHPADPDAARDRAIADAMGAY